MSSFGEMQQCVHQNYLSRRGKASIFFCNLHVLDHAMSLPIPFC